MLISEEILQHLISETIDELITEGDSRINAVKRIIANAFKGVFVMNSIVISPTYYVNNNPNTTWGDYLLYNFRHTFGLMTNPDIKYMPYIASIAFGNEVMFDQENQNVEKIGKLVEIVNFLKKDESLFSKVSQQCQTFTELNDIMSPILKDKKEQMKNDINSETYNLNSDYIIKEVPDFKTANFYGNHSCSSSKLCYTQGESTWKAFTNNGANKVYVCLKNGWEEEREVPYENAPYDSYGLSMIFVFVNPEGELVFSNTRWNHKNAGDTSVDHSFTEKQLSDLLGTNFYRTFLPYANILKEETYKKKPNMKKANKPYSINPNIYSIVESVVRKYLNSLS